LNIKRKKSTAPTATRDEKREEQLLMGSIKREWQLFGMNKGMSKCCWGSIRLLRHFSGNATQGSPIMTC
jgi:hypothetical protein